MKVWLIEWLTDWLIDWLIDWSSTWKGCRVCPEPSPRDPGEIFKSWISITYGHCYIVFFISTLSVNNCFQILFKILNKRNYVAPHLYLYYIILYYVAPHLYLYAVLWLMILFSLNNYFRLKIEINKIIF